MNRRIAVAAVFALLLLASAYAQTTDFFELVRTGTPQEVQVALDNGADLNAHNIGDGTTPLIAAAAYNKNPEVVTTLLKAGAGLEARDSVHGGTALLWAASFNKNPEVTATLLTAGADIRASNTLEGRTALLWAAYWNNPEVIVVLLNAGADAKAKDKAGKTALDYARYTQRDADVLRRLEEASQ